MPTEVAVLEPREIVITNDQTELIKRTICQGATDAEMKLFFFDCQRRGTHPLDKLIHFTKRDGKYTPVTSIDFFRLRAHSSGAYAGEGATTYELAEDGLPNECTVSVLRLVQGQVCTWWATARWAEYYPGEKSGFMWKKMPFLMLAKCAEALALRKAFPAELQGLYVKEEMDQAGHEQKPLRTPSDILRDSERPPTDLETQLQASIDTVHMKPSELHRRASEEAKKEALDSVEQHNASIDAAAPRGGKTLQEEGLANDNVKSDANMAWSELIALSETVKECSATLNRMEADVALDLFSKTQLREEGKQKILSLRAKKVSP